MKYRTNILFIVLTFSLFISCNEKQKKKDILNVEIPEYDKGKELEENPLKKSKELANFLENPIDLIKYKKDRKLVTTSVTNGLDYHLHPNIKDSIFYVYHYPNINNGYRGLFTNIKVFKFGNNKHKYEDITEKLIELQIESQDSLLGRSNLVGLTKQELATKFGNDCKIIDNQVVYWNKNKIVIFKMNDLKVESYRYVKLNTEKIDSVLIRRIIKE